MDRFVTCYVTIPLFGVPEDGPRSMQTGTRFDHYAPGKIITPDISNESFENVGTDVISTNCMHTALPK